MILLSTENAALIRAEGETAYPNECCGVLLGKLEAGTGGSPDRREAESLLPIVNKQEDAEQYHRFEITPEDYLHAEKEARKQNRDILGFYHSHPDHPAIPSDFDKNNALPFYILCYSVGGKRKGRRTAKLGTCGGPERIQRGGHNMAITILIPTALRSFTERKSEVSVEGATAGEAIGALAEAYPDSGQRELRSFINVFVGDTNIKNLQGLDTAVKGGDTIMLVPAIAGGNGKNQGPPPHRYGRGKDKRPLVCFGRPQQRGGRGVPQYPGNSGTRGAPLRPAGAAFLRP